MIQLRTVSKHYPAGFGRSYVLRNIDLDIAQGEFVSIMGPSGSGKSTLLHIAGLLDQPQAGTINIVDTDASNANDVTRTRLRNTHIGFIYQFHNLLGELTAEENVMMPQLIAGVKKSAAKQRAQVLLVRLGLAQRITHLPAQLSGGEQQRVAIARALANKPQLILADEPTGNLDPTTSESVLQLFLDIAREEGVAALIATHNMALAKRLTRSVTVREGTLEAVLV